MVQGGESRMAPGAPGTVCSLVEKAPGDGKIKWPFREGEHTRSTSFLSWRKKKTGDINLIGLSRRGEKPSLLISCGRTKQTQGHVQPGWPALRFQSGVTSLKMCFIIAKRHALQLPYCVLHKGWWNIKDVENGANPSRRHCKGLSLCLLLGSCCPGTQAQGHEKRQSLNYQVHPRRTRRRPICSSGTRKRS